MTRLLLVLTSLVLINYQQPSRAESLIKIGLMATLSGESASLGKQCQDGYEVARRALAPNNVVGKYKVDFIYSDTRSDANTAVSEFHRLVNREQVVALVTHRSQTTMALNPLSVRAKIPLIGVVGQNDFVVQNPYAYRVWPTAIVEADTLVDSAWTKGFRRAALVTVQDEYTIAVTESFRKSWTKRGGQIVYEQTVLPNNHDFLGLIPRIAKLKPDIVLNNVGFTAVGQFSKQLRQAGFSGPILGGIWLSSSDFLTQAGESGAEGSVFAGIPHDTPNYMKILKSINSEDSLGFISVGYACYVALSLVLHNLHNIEKINSPATKDSLHAQMQGTNRIPLLDEILDLKDREVQFKLDVFTYTNGELKRYL